VFGTNGTIITLAEVKANPNDTRLANLSISERESLDDMIGVFEAGEADLADVEIML